MARIWVRLAIAVAVTSFLAGSAMADPSFWVKCDGYPKPEPETSKLERRLASAATIGLVRSPEIYSAVDRAHDLAGVAACDQALDSLGETPETLLRRASLLEARAIHKVEADQAHAALADVEAARRAASGATDDIHFVRSTGLSLDLLQSYIALREGNDGEAARLAGRAAAARPFSSGVQHLALYLMSFDDGAREAQGALAEQLDRLNPAVRVETSDFLWRLGRFSAAWTDAAPLFGPASGWMQASTEPLDAAELGRSYAAAYSAARAGQAETARAILAASRRRLSEATWATDRNFIPAHELNRKALDQQRPVLLAGDDTWRTIIESAILLQAGQARQAQALLLEKTTYSVTPALGSLIGDLQSALPVGERQGMIARDPQELTRIFRGLRADRVAKIGQELFAILPQPEDAAALTRYEGELFLKFKHDGFTERRLANGATEITFKANLFSREAADEMVLLRAADLARRAGMSTVLITDRHDYTSWAQATRYGAPVGDRVQVGYESVIEVRFGDGAGPPAIAAAPVEAALAPVYLTASPPTK